MKSSFFAYLIALFVLSLVASAAPTTQPAIDVTIAPFTPLDDSAATWIGKAVQQNLIADLARQHFRPSESAGDDGYIIQGTYQLADPLIRFSGQLLEVRSGKVVGGLSATGSSEDLFTLEDTLSRQAAQQLGQLIAPAASHTPAAPPVAQPLAIVPPPAEVYERPTIQEYLGTDFAPSNDYADQVNASNYRQMYQYNFSNYYFGYYSPYFWGPSYGPIYGVGFGRLGFHNGWYGFTGGFTTR